MDNQFGLTDKEAKKRGEAFSKKFEDTAAAVASGCGAVMNAAMEPTFAFIEEDFEKALAMRCIPASALMASIDALKALKISDDGGPLRKALEKRRGGSSDKGS